MHSDSPRCKICGADTFVAFSLPHEKLSGHPIPEKEDDCPYFQCRNCHFLFSRIHDSHSQNEIYSEDYWKNQDPDWNGRVSETLRLIMFASKYIDSDPWDAQILDFGCGMGCSIVTGRNLGLNLFGVDLNPPLFGREYFMPNIQSEQFDLIIACEVFEHLSHPSETLDNIVRGLKPGGILAFQTAYYDPDICKRDWWYLGPANGHISLYSVQSLQMLALKSNLIPLQKWNGYHGIQIWKKPS